MLDRVLELLEAKKFSEVKQLAADMHSADIAAVFDHLDDRETAIKFFRLLPKELAAEVFAYMEPDAQQQIIETVTDVELRGILDDMFLDDYVDLIEEMPANVVTRVMNNSSRENRSLINQYLQYPEDSAGSIMTNEYVALRADMTVEQALKHIRKTGVDKETLDNCFVTSPDKKLIGVVTLREIVFAEPDTMIGDLMNTHVFFAYTHDDKEEIGKKFSKYDMLSLPVVDTEERLVGIITIDDAVDVIQDENTEDFQKMAGMAPSDDTYLKTPVITLAKNRIVWLLILMISAMITGAMLEYYEAAIATIPLLVSFIPMLMDTGGNSGSQASTMIIRGMALDEIELKDFLRVWWKEARVALLCGTLLSAVNFLRIWLQYNDVGVAAVVSLTLIITVFLAKSLGCILPMLARALKLDPALMASPMITTITDACSIMVFFTLALNILRNRL